MQHWLTLVAGGESISDKFGKAVQWLALLFYADDGLLVSLQLARL